MDINAARNSIGEFCMNECNGYCCKKGVISITKKEAVFIREKLPNTINLFNNQAWFFRVEGGCEFLDGPKCTIHKNPLRPSVCMEFPIFELGNKITFSKGCPAVQQEKFYPYIQILLKNGYKFESKYTLSKE